METIYRHLRCTNEKVDGYLPGTKIEAMFYGKEGSTVCVANTLDLSDDWVIGFDTKQLSHILYAYPKRHVFKLKTRSVPYLRYPLLESIELVELPK